MKQMESDNQKQYYQDIKIVEQEFAETKLNHVVLDAAFLCDIYCIPSHNNQAFYVKIYDDNNTFILQYAKSYITNPKGDEIVMYPFTGCILARKHNVAVGKIICGIIRLPKNNATINSLISCLPTTSEWQETNGIKIDGVYTVIRCRSNEEIIALAYSSAYDIQKNFYTKNQLDFFENLYLYIEEIVGNVLAN